MKSSAKNQSNKRKSNRDYNLIVNGKFNRRAIMQRAYAILHTYSFYTFERALKQAWQDAKYAMEEELKFKDWQPQFAQRSMNELYCTRDMQKGYATR